MGMLITIGAGIVAVVVLGLVVTVILVARNRRNAAPSPAYGGYQHPAQQAQPGPPHPQAPQHQPGQPPYQPNPYAQQPPYPGQ
ncbi:hypothetical protein [Streptomyces chryseus]